VPITDPLFYLVAVPAVLLAGISKGGFGAGLGILAVPLMTLRVPPTQAAAIMLPILCLMDIFGIGAYRRTWDRANLTILFSGALVGTAIGAASFRYLDESLIRLLLGIIALAFIASRWFGRGDRPPAPRSLVKGGFWGMVAGFTSFVAHAGGPPVSVYLLPQRLDKTLFVGTTVVFFFAVNYVKLLPYYWLGQFPQANLATSLALAPVAVAGVLLGIWLHDRIDVALFYRLCYGCTTGSTWRCSIGCVTACCSSPA
jgi:uncharacterized membrane protein YfcA